MKCALTRREENLDSGNRNATIQKLRAGARADGTLTALEGEFIAALGWAGWHASTAGPMQMLYACDNVRTLEYAAKLNTPPMKAFRAPGFVEGTFGLECLLDELAAKLDVDPLEIRRRNYAHSTEGRSYSSKNLMQCYERAEKHWERRHEVKAMSDRTWKRGVGMASQVWYGGGGPPSYAWIRLGADGRVQVVTAMQDIGTGSKTAMQQIAAEELGLSLDRVEITAGDTARGPYASISAGSSTIPSMGPAVRAAAADTARQVIEIAAQRHHREERTLSLKNGHVVCSDGGSWPLEEIVGVLESGQILGKGARGPNPTGMQVLTFGVQVAEVAVDVETGEVRVERIAAIHDVGRVINPLGASSQVEGGIIQGIGHTLSEERLLDPQTGRTLTVSLDAYKLPTIADVPEIITDLLDVADPHLTNLGAKGLGEPPIVPDGRGDRERDSRRDRRRRPLAADHARGDAARARGSTEARTRARGRPRLSLDVFLESGEDLDREEVEAALARHGVGADSIVSTADGGDAGVSVDDDGAVFIVRSLTRELAQVIFEVAVDADLAILPADGTPTALVASYDATVPDDLDPVDVPDADALFGALRRSEELRGARTA